MTEYNLFCYSENYNDENSFQQKRDRTFNIEVGKERYYEILSIVKEILPRQQTLLLSDFWKSVTKEQWQKLLAIPEAKDFKKGFEYISGIEIDDVNIEKIKIGDFEYNKAEVEKALSDIKPLS